MKHAALSIIIGLSLMVGSLQDVFAQSSGTIPGCTDAQCNINYTPPLPSWWNTGTATPTTGSTSGGSTAASCSTVTGDNYDACCSGFNPSTAAACDDYIQNQFSQAPAGTGIGSGTQPVTPLNTTTAGGNGTIAATPRSDSEELASCSAIKFKSLLDILIWLKCIIVAALIPLIFAAAFLFFLWGVFRFLSASDSTKKEESKRFILWGMVALFVMVSLWGIIKILSDTLGIQEAVPLLQTESLDVKNASH